jgi:lipopolysaccharide/colanic/teichoic acid biosynthesis glycosyltransferase
MKLLYIRPQDILLIRWRYRIAKRVFDMIVCLVLLPFVLLVMGLCALLIYLDDPGPVIFVQERTGKGGRRFGMYKFRTMVTDAEELKQHYQHLNELTLPDFKITNDPRITRIGHFLRKTSLDELPQVFNVLKGEMSLVGPRPTSFDVSTYSLWHTERLEVLPGITGLWQISGRSNVDFDQRLQLDVEYIESQSFWFDLEILLRTFLVVFKQTGAH